MCHASNFPDVKPCRIEVIAGDPLARAGIVSMLSKVPEFEIQSDGGKQDADVVVVVVQGGDDVIDTLRTLTRRARPRFVVISRNYRAIDLCTASELGLAAVVPLRDISLATLRRGVAAALAGGLQLPPDSQAWCMAQMIRVKRELLEPRGLSLHRLDSREVELLRLLADGWDLKEIAEKLNYSERTVKNILHMLTVRLRLRNRTHAVAYAIRMGAV